MRPAAYAVIVSGRLVLAVQENEGLYLPGGGREPGETASQNVTRELAEEIGRVPALLTPLGSAVEFFPSSVDACWYELRASFFLAVLTDEVLPSAQFEIQWVEPAAFKRASHAWAAGLVVPERP